MKGATVGHAKQRIRDGRYLGLTEPTIIAAESPNPICNELVILPDMEKRLEAFVRMAHGIVVFPGGVGTAEEILVSARHICSRRRIELESLPLIFTGPAESRAYFERLHAFIGCDARAGGTAALPADPRQPGRGRGRDRRRVCGASATSGRNGTMRISSTGA